MANVSGLRICPICGSDMGEVAKGKPCPICGSDDLVRLEKRRAFLNDMSEKGFAPMVPVAKQLRDRLRAIEATPMGQEEKAEMIRETQKMARDLLQHMPGDIKIDVFQDCLRILSHQLLGDLTTAKDILSLGMKIGKICENIDGYQKLRGRD